VAVLEGIPYVRGFTLRLPHGAQDDASNPLVGAEGRAALLQKLGGALEEHPEFFGSPDGRTFRPGFLVDYLFGKADADHQVCVCMLGWACCCRVGA
jgi:hypothetical protein